MDTLIFTDNNSYQEAKRPFTNAISIIQGVVNAYNAMPIDNLTTNELNRAFADYDSLIFDKLTADQPVVLSGLTLNKSKAMAIMEHPAGYAAFVTAVLIAQDKLTSMRIAPTNPQAYFQIGANDIVEISPVLDAQLLEANKYYTRSTRAEKEKAFAEAVVSAFNANDIAVYYSGSGLDTAAIIKRLLNKDNTINHKVLNQYKEGMATMEVLQLH